MKAVLQCPQRMTFILGGPRDGWDIDKTKAGPPPQDATDIYLELDPKHVYILAHYTREKQTSKDRYFRFVGLYDSLREKPLEEGK